MKAVVWALSAVLVCAWAAGVWVGFLRIFGSPPKRAPRGQATPDDLRRPLSLRTEDGIDLVAWHYPGHLQAMVIVSWGYRNLTDESRRLCLSLQKEGFHVLAHGWRGTSEASGGRCTAGRQEAMDLRAAVDAAERILPGCPIGVIGLSIGGAVALRVAADDHRIRAVCVDSLLTAPIDWVRDRYREHVGAASWLFADPVLALALLLRRANAWRVRPLLDLAALPPRPLFMITSTDDQLVGPARQEKVRAAAPPPKEEWIVEASHCSGFFVSRRTYTGLVADFFRAMACETGAVAGVNDRPAASQVAG